MKRNQTKMWLKWSIPLSLALLLAACGGKSDNKNNDASPSVSPSPSTSASASPSPSPSSSASASPSPSGSASASASSEAIAGFETFKDEASGLEIQYPKEWTKSTDVPGALVAFLAPVDSGATFQPNVNVVVQDLGGQAIDLAQYIDLSKQQLQQLITDFKLVTDESVTTDSGLEVHGLEYTGKQGQNNLTWLQLITINNGKAYVLTYTGDEKTYEKYIDTVEKMTESMIVG